MKFTNFIIGFCIFFLISTNLALYMRAMDHKARAEFWEQECDNIWNRMGNKLIPRVELLEDGITVEEIR